MAVAFDAVSEDPATGYRTSSSASFTHTPSGTPKGVLIFVVRQGGSIDDITSVTYGGVTVPAVSGGLAADTTGELGLCKAFFLGTGVPTGAQTVAVSYGANAHYVVCITVTASLDTEIYTSGIVLLQEDGTVAEQSVGDGSPGTNSLRFVGGFSGLSAFPGVGANSTALVDNSVGLATSAGAARETTAGQGSRSVGFSTGTTEDRAYVHLAVRELGAALATPSTVVASASVPAPTILTGANGLITPATVAAIATVVAPTVRIPDAPVAMPTLIVQMDSGNLTASGGFVLDDATLGKLDTAFLGAGEPSWDYDITGYVRGLSISRGTSNELQRIEAGTASILLDNRDGRFTPTNTLSPYYPDIVPMRRIRIQAQTEDAVIYPIFVGFAEGWPVTFPEIVDQVVEVQLVDGFSVLARSVISGTFSAQTTGQRVTDILDSIEWPAVQRDIETGASSVPEVVLSNAPVLEHLQQVAHAEGGRLFMSKDGKITFRDRYPTVASPTDLLTRTWSDTGTDMTYRDITLTFNDETLFNDIRLTRTGGMEQTAESLDSIQQFFRRALVESDIQLATDAEVASLADELLERYAEPRLRIVGLADNAMRHGFWRRLLERELQDQVLVKKTPAGSDAISQNSQLEGIAHELTAGTWTVTLAVSPSTATLAWVLDDLDLSILDNSTVLAR
jgi:hypothetical protein